ncbi:MAG: hypothetical protein KDK59_11665, partial [Simkania sp.]|nr:hypothetical protein [Simkania sp.]
LYHHLLKLVKVHRVLDSAETPEYVVSFVLYHEMLHSVCSSAVGKRGRRKIHTKEFREKEKLFHQYREAAEWIHKNRERFFI